MPWKQYYNSILPITSPDLGGRGWRRLGDAWGLETGYEKEVSLRVETSVWCHTNVLSHISLQSYEFLFLEDGFECRRVWAEGGGWRCLGHIEGGGWGWRLFLVRVKGEGGGIIMDRTEGECCASWVEFWENGKGDICRNGCSART